MRSPPQRGNIEEAPIERLTEILQYAASATRGLAPREMVRIPRTGHPINAIPSPTPRGEDRGSKRSRVDPKTVERTENNEHMGSGGDPQSSPVSLSTRAMKQPASPFLICTYRTPGIVNASSITCSGGVPFTRV